MIENLADYQNFCHFTSEVHSLCSVFSFIDAISKGVEVSGVNVAGLLLEYVSENGAESVLVQSFPCQITMWRFNAH